MLTFESSMDTLLDVLVALSNHTARQQNKKEVKTLRDSRTRRRLKHCETAEQEGGLNTARQHNKKEDETLRDSRTSRRIQVEW